MNYDLSFVNLGINIRKMVNHINVFGFKIAFYGIIIGIGMILGLWVVTRDAKRRGQDPDLYSDFALYAIIAAIIGARAYYVIFSWDYYKNNLSEIINIRGGGLAIYGAVIASVITLIIYARKKGESFVSMADSAVLGLVTGQIIGRWGNFFNMEAFGGYTDSLFAMRIKETLVNPSMISKDLLENIIEIDGIRYIQVHPTFLYEALWNLALLIFMLWYRDKKKFNGEMFLIYLGGYGLGRAVIEGLRTDSLMLAHTGIAVSQLLAFVCFICSIVVIYLGRRHLKNSPN